MKEVSTKDGGPKFIRTLGSQSLSGLNPLSSTGNSQSPSVSLSPNVSPEVVSNEEPPVTKMKSPSVAAQTPSQRQQHLAAEVSEVGSTTSVSSVANSNFRVAQACDRCRSKKTRCDGKRPQCSQCAAVGFECRISDKLSRRAFPRGYTETLEERVRELEAENRRLVALCDIKEQQIHLVSDYTSNKRRTATKESDEQMLQELSSANGGRLRVSSTNLFLLNKTRDSKQNTTNSTSDDLEIKHEHLQDPKGQDENKKQSCDDVCCNDKLHSKPVSTNLNDPTSISFEQNEAPGLPAVKALTSMATREQSTQLATLVALSVPRSTEEILFIPQLLARIRQIHGFTSKQCLYSVSLLSSLKGNLPGTQLLKWDQLDYLKFTNLWEIDSLENFFHVTLKLNIMKNSDSNVNDTTPNSDDDSISLSMSEIDDLVNLFFENWSIHIPILDKEEFFSYYNKLKDDIRNQPALFQNGPNSFARRNKIISYKIFACILFTVCQMGLLTKVKKETNKTTEHSKYIKLISYYHRAISLIYLNPYFTVLTTSLQSLQFLSLLLFYFLNTGNVSAIYELRGRLVSMAQQLRLHRCPSAVLGGSGSTMNKREQGDRRVLFWGIYYLDVFSALQLGVPRLIKDFEIECALPVADNDDKKVSLAGQMIRLEGRVSKFSLAIIRFSKVLGNILDTIFKRGMTESITKKLALIHENALDNWRRGLPAEYRFELDVNGTINMDEFNKLKHMNATVQNVENMVLLVFYFLAKCMIHLPVVATRRLPSSEDIGDCSEEADAQRSKDDGGDSNLAVRSSSSYVLLQQATNTMLNVLELLKAVYLPLPINLARTKARFALLSARGSLEYIKGGALFLDNKALLLDVIKGLEEDRKLEIPGIISWHSLKLLDMTINLLLQPPNTKVEKLDKLLKKKLNYYNRMMGCPIVRTASIKREANSTGKNIAEDSLSKNQSNSSIEANIRATNLTPISSKSDGSPPEKKIKLEDDYSEPINSTKGYNIPKPSGNTSRLDRPMVPISTQSAIAEALQLDPVLNSNILSDTDLAAFFSGNLSSVNGHGQPEMHLGNVTNSAATQLDMNRSNTDQKATLATLNKPQGKQAVPPYGSTAGLDGLFRVPSNADFFMDEYYPSGNSQLNLALLNNSSNNHASNHGRNTSNQTMIDYGAKNTAWPSTSNGTGSFPNMSFNNLLGYSEGINGNMNGGMNPGNDSNVSGFNFAVDASLGLAPLLDWSSDINAHNSPSKTASNPSDRSGIILDTTVQHEQDELSRKQSNDMSKRDSLHHGYATTRERPHTDTPTWDQKVPTLASNGYRNHAQQDQDGRITSGLDSNDDGTQNMLTLGSRRGPRRRHTVYRHDANGVNNGQEPRSNHEENLHNLFRWQNSK